MRPLSGPSPQFLRETNVPFQTRFPWSRAVAMTRVLLSAAALWKIYSLPRTESPFLCAVLGVFLAFAVVVAVRHRLQSGTLGLLTLFGDTVFFLVLAGYGTEAVPWLSTVFYLHLLTEAISFFGPVEVFVVVGVSVLFCLLLPSAHNVPLVRTVVVGGAMTCACSLARRRLETTIRALRAQVKEAQLAKDRSLAEERQRIASDFHDGPLQSFISLQMRLEILRQLLERDFATGLEDLRQLQVLAQSQIRDLRAFLHNMRPVEVDGANLMASARRTAESFQKESGIPVTFLGANTPVGLPEEASGEVLQMLREALHNVQKHAGATRVAVAMEKTDRGLEISVDDNGHGFSFAGAYSLEELELLRLGPASLKRRARSLNAELMLESRPGRGAGLKVRIPLQ